MAAGTGLESQAGRKEASASSPFTLDVPRDCAVPVLLSVPHSGRDYRADLLGRMRDPSRTLLRLEDRHVDAIAREVARQTGAALLVATAPRAEIDLNRAPEDMDWGMVTGSQKARAEARRGALASRRSRGGLGLVPRRLAGLGEIWRGAMEEGELQRRIDTVHRPYHVALAQTLEAIRDRWGAALLLDIHSMPPLKPAGSKPAAEFVIGDRFGASCDGMLSARALRALGAQSRPVAHNRPYAGGYVLDRHAAPRRGIHAMQLEICRATYLDSRLDEPSARVGAVARSIVGLVRELASDVALIGQGGGLPLAAE